AKPTANVIVPTRSFSTRPHPIRSRQCGPASRRHGVASPRARDAFRACAMFSLFERLLKPTDPPEQAAPPPGFAAFFCHFARQRKGLFAALFAAGLVVALLDSTIPCSSAASSR